MSYPQKNSKAQSSFDTASLAVRSSLSESLQRVLVPLFNAGTSRRAVPELRGTAFCIDCDGYRFLATAGHVLDDLHDGTFVRDGRDQSAAR